MLNFYTFGPLVVTVTAHRGVILAVRDAITGADAQSHYTRGEIAQAISLARLAWETENCAFV